MKNMGTFNENISIIGNAKNDIASSLRRKNVNLSYTDGFVDYPQLAGNIKHGKLYNWQSIGYGSEMPKFIIDSFVKTMKMIPSGQNYIVDEGTNLEDKYKHFNYTAIFPSVKFPNATNLYHTFNETPILFIGDIYFPANDISVYRMFDKCYALKYVGNLFTGNLTHINGIFNECKSLRKIKSVDMASVEVSSIVCGNIASLSSMTVKNIGMKDLSSNSVVEIDFSHTPSWGINCRFDPNAHQTIVDSLINYSCDRVYHNYSGLFRFELPKNYDKLLTRSEARAIIAKGYELFIAYWVKNPNGTYSLDHEVVLTENDFPETL